MLSKKQSDQLEVIRKRWNDRKKWLSSPKRLDGDVEWITVKGTHIPLKDGKADVLRHYAKEARLQRLKKLFPGCIIRHDSDEGGTWVTIKGTHVLIDDTGTVIGGPDNLKGRSLEKGGNTQTTYFSNRESFSSLTKGCDWVSGSNFFFSNYGNQEKLYTIEYAISEDADDFDVKTVREHLKQYVKAYYQSIGDDESLAALEKDYKKCGSNKEKRKQFIKKYADAYVEAREQHFQKEIDGFSDADRMAKTESVIKRENKSTSALLSQCTGTPVTPGELYEMRMQRLKTTTPEELALDTAYCGGNVQFGLYYKHYTKRKINGEPLTDAMKRYEEIVEGKASILPEGKSVYRKTGLDELKAITGIDISSVDELPSRIDLSGKKYTYDKLTSVGTAIQSDHFRNAKVYVEYVSKGGARAYVTQCWNEAELILPVGTTLSNMTVQRGSPVIPVISSYGRGKPSEKWRPSRKGIDGKDLDAYANTPKYEGAQSYDDVIYLRVEVG